MRSFKETQEFLNSIPNINLGGCGIAALALYEAAKHSGKKVGITYTYSKWFDGGSKAHNDKFKLGLAKKAVACHHILIKVGTRYYDSTGPIALKDFFFFDIDKDITPEHLLASVVNTSEWNPTFDRKKYLPKIEKFIGKKLLNR